MQTASWFARNGTAMYKNLTWHIHETQFKSCRCKSTTRPCTD